MAVIFFVYVKLAESENEEIQFFKNYWISTILMTKKIDFYLMVNISDFIVGQCSRSIAKKSDLKIQYGILFSDITKNNGKLSVKSWILKNV